MVLVVIAASGQVGCAADHRVALCLEQVDSGGVGCKPNSALPSC